MCDAIRRVARKAIPLAAIRKLSSSRSSKRTNGLIDRARFLLAWFCGFVRMGFSSARYHECGKTGKQGHARGASEAAAAGGSSRPSNWRKSPRKRCSAAPRAGLWRWFTKRAAAFSPHVKFSDWPYSLSRPAICPGYRTRLKQPRAELLLSYRADGIVTPEKTPALVGPPSLHLGLALKAHRS